MSVHVQQGIRKNCNRHYGKTFMDMLRVTAVIDNRMQFRP